MSKIKNNLIFVFRERNMTPPYNGGSLNNIRTIILDNPNKRVL